MLVLVVGICGEHVWHLGIPLTLFGPLGRLLADRANSFFLQRNCNFTLYRYRAIAREVLLLIAWMNSSSCHSLPIYGGIAIFTMDDDAKIISAALSETK